MGIAWVVVVANPESLVVERIRVDLEGRGCIVVKIHGSRFMPEGFPDLVVVRPDGVSVFVEVKVPGRSDGPGGGGLSRMQLRWLWRLGAQGARCGVASSPGQARLVVFGSSA